MVHLNFQLDCKFENKDGSFEFYWVTFALTILLVAFLLISGFFTSGNMQRGCHEIDQGVFSSRSVRKLKFYTRLRLMLLLGLLGSGSNVNLSVSKFPLCL
jgi:hypothetical protein